MALPVKFEQPVRDVGDVAADVGLHGRVDERGHRALVLAVLAEHLARDRDDRVGVLAAQDVAHPQLVGIVGVGVDQADADGGDALVLEPAGRRDGRLLVEGADLRTGEVEPTTHRAHAVRRDDAVGLDPEVGVPVAVGHRLAGDLEHELVALGGDEAERLDLALEQLVGRHRRAVETAVMSLPPASTMSRIFSMPAMKPSAGLPGVLGVFVVTSSPESSSKATTSVNVPPVSMPILIRRALMGTIQQIRPPRWPRQSLPTEGPIVGSSDHRRTRVRRRPPTGPAVHQFWA